MPLHIGTRYARRLITRAKRRIIEVTSNPLVCTPPLHLPNQSEAIPYKALQILSEFGNYMRQIQKVRCIAPTWSSRHSDGVARCKYSLINIKQARPPSNHVISILP